MTPPPPPSTPERPLSATRLAQYATVRGRCERYLRLALFPSEGAALMLRNNDLPRLAATAIDLLRVGPRLAQMREAMRRLARPDAARDAAALVWEAAA